MNGIKLIVLAIVSWVVLIAFALLTYYSWKTAVGFLE